MLFNSIERVRLWNTLVFSEGYFKRATMSQNNQRQDLANFFEKNIENRIKEDEGKAMKELYEQNNNPKAQLSLDEGTRRKIRDKYFTPDVMLELWGLMKHRKFVRYGEPETQMNLVERLKTLRFKKA
jgi:hypothetical protein